MNKFKKNEISIKDKKICIKIANKLFFNQFEELLTYCNILKSDVLLFYDIHLHNKFNYIGVVGPK